MHCRKPSATSSAKPVPPRRPFPTSNKVPATFPRRLASNPSSLKRLELKLEGLLALTLEHAPGKLPGLPDETSGQRAGIIQARFKKFSQQRQPAGRKDQLQFRFPRKL